MKTNSLLALHSEYFRTSEAREIAYGRTCERLEYPEGHYRTDDCPTCAEYRMRWEAFTDAARAFDAAERALIDAVFAAGGGQQPDGSFVTVSSCFPRTDKEARDLHAPAKQGVLAEFSATHWASYNRNGGYRRNWSHKIEAIRTRAEARSLREAERAERRAAQAAYDSYSDKAAPK